MLAEKIAVRSLIALCIVFILVSLAYYPPVYAVPGVVFLMVFIVGDRLLFSDSKVTEKTPQGWRNIAIKVIVILLIVTSLVCLASIIAMWKLGPFWKFNSG